MSDSFTKQWQDPEKRDRIITGLRAAWARRRAEGTTSPGPSKTKTESQKAYHLRNWPRVLNKRLKRLVGYHLARSTERGMTRAEAFEELRTLLAGMEAGEQ